jgi:twitching motility protein PilI
MTPDGQHLSIRAGAERYLLPVSAVVELLPVPASSPVPTAPGWLAGVAALHGELVAVVDFARFMGVADPLPPSQCLLFDRAVAALALLVSGVEHMVASVPQSDHEATPIDPEALISRIEAALSPLFPSMRGGD